jgi:hypothetical protein
MRRLRGIAVWCLALALVAFAGPAQAQASGSSPATAVTLPGIQHETAGVDAEYAYIREHFPGCKPRTQALLTDKGRHYDSIQLAGPNCANAVFFDITDWFGK